MYLYKKAGRFFTQMSGGTGSQDPATSTPQASDGTGANDGRSDSGDKLALEEALALLQFQEVFEPAATGPPPARPTGPAPVPGVCVAEAADAVSGVPTAPHAQTAAAGVTGSGGGSESGSGSDTVPYGGLSSAAGLAAASASGLGPVGSGLGSAVSSPVESGGVAAAAAPPLAAPHSLVEETFTCPISQVGAQRIPDSVRFCLALLWDLGCV